MLRILFDNNVPVGVRDFLTRHEVLTLVEMNWPPQLENGELLKAAEATGFDVLVTSDQNIRYQQNLAPPTCVGRAWLEHLADCTQPWRGNRRGIG